MRIQLPLLALLCAGASSATALAQDSVSKTLGLPGDAVDAHATGEQINDYVVDMTAFRSSWGKTFGVAPIVKFSQQRGNLPDFATSSVSAQAMSRLTKSGAPFLRSSYSRWSAPGFGVNDNSLRNDPGTAVSTTGFMGYQFAVAGAEFGLGDPSSTTLSNVIGGVVNFTDAVPSRLYVSRVVAATNADTDACSLASFALGAVDEDGNVVLRADAFALGGVACAGLMRLGSTSAGGEQQNLFTVDLTARGAGLLNVLSDSFPTGGDFPATNRVQANAYSGFPGFTTNTPNIIPESVAGRRIVIGSNTNIQYLYESTAGTVIAQAQNAHLAAGVTNHRGAVGYTANNFTGLFAGSINGTGGMLGSMSGNNGTKFLNLFGLGANGVNLNSMAVTLPAVVTDPDQPAWSSTNVTPNQQFDHYHDQTFARGGTSAVALGRDNAGNLLAAAVVYGTTIPGPPPSYATGLLYPNSYIAVARIDPTTGVPTWSAAAWTQEGGVAVSDGKTIYQNGVTPIGRLRAYTTPPAVTYPMLPVGPAVPGTAGPTLSAPMIDSFGNVWFLGTFELSADLGTIRVGLFRAVYDAAAFSYKLELVVKESDVFAGQNSGTNYKISALELVDSNSISSSTSWSNNISGASFKNVATGTLANDDAGTLGGIILNARITYDVNGDSVFGTASPDEFYNVLLYIGASADCDLDGIPDDREIADALDLDTNLNGIPDSCEGIIGVPFCSGDGSDTACPCGNPSVGFNRGCNNTINTGGANITGTGVPSVTFANDTLVLTGSSLIPFGPGLYYQGSTPALAGPPFGVGFGHGLRCAGGATPRLEIVVDNGTGGDVTAGDGITRTTVKISVLGTTSAGDVRHYQLWYRDSGAINLCTSTAQYFNLSNAITLTWVP